MIPLDLQRFRRWLGSTVLLGAVILAIAPARAAEPPRPWHVLLIFDGNRGLPRIQKLEDESRRILQVQSKRPVVVFSEYLDSDARDPGSRRNFRDYLAAKHGVHNLDIVVTFVSKHVDWATSVPREAFPDLPVVYSHFTFAGERIMTPVANSTGITVPPDIEGTLEAALRVHPGTEHLYLVGGDATADRQAIEFSAAAVARMHPELPRVIVTHQSLPQVRQTLATVPRNSVIIFTTFRRDSQGQAYRSEDALAVLAAAANAPTYAFFDNDLGTGITGGSIVSERILAQEVSGLVLRVLNGEPAASIPVREARVSVPTFDATALRRWGINEVNLPARSVIVGLSPSTWSDQPAAVVVGLAIIGVLTVLLGAMAVHSVRRRRLYEELRHTESQQRSVVESQAEQICRFLPDTTLTFVNDAYCRYFDRPRSELLGRKFLELLPESRRASMQSRIAALSPKNREFRNEHEVIAADGTIRWHCWTNSVAEEKNGRVVELQGIGRDLTSSRRVLQALRESEERYHAFINNSTECIWRYEFTPPIPITLPKDEQIGLIFRRGVLAECNLEVARIYGFPTVDAALGARLEEVMPASRPENVEILRAFVRCGYRLTNHESTEGNPNGELHLLSNTISGIVHEGLLVGVWGTSRELTREKRTIEALKLSEERYARATQAGSVGVWDWDLTTETLVVDPGLKTLLGFRADELRDHTDDWRRRIHSDDVLRVTEKIQAHLRGLTPCFEMAHRMLHKDGSIRWFLARGTIQYDTAGKPVRMVGTSTDITGLKQTEEATRESERRFGHLADAAPMLIWMSGTDKPLTYVNKGWLDFTGKTPEQECGNGWLTGVHPDDAAPATGCYGAAFDAHEQFTTEFRLRRHDGQYRWILNHGVPRFTASGDFLGYVGFCLDITERKNNEAELQQSRQELVHLSRVSSLGALSSALAHELNQPLGAILSNAQAALRYLTNEPNNLVEVREILRDIVGEDQRAGEVIRRMRALLKRGQPQYLPVDLNHLVNEVVWLMRSELMHRGTTVDLLLERNLVEVSGDRVPLQQVLINLLLNGSDAMQHLPPTQRRLLVRTTHRKGVEVTLSVTDGGTGLKPDDMSRLFTPFYTTKKQGMGVGLAICKSILDAHGGRLWAENNHDRGATFHFALPVAQEIIKKIAPEFDLANRNSAAEAAVYRRGQYGFTPRFTVS